MDDATRGPAKQKLDKRTASMVGSSVARPRPPRALLCTGDARHITTRLIRQVLQAPIPGRTIAAPWCAMLVVLVDEGQIIAQFGLPPRHDDLPLIRADLQRRADIEHSEDGEGDTLPMRALAILLFAAGQPEDALAIWRAKQSCFDAGISIEVQLLCGAGYDATLAYLRATATPEAAAAHQYILECAAAGDFAAFSPETALANHRSYFGLHL